MIRLSKARRKKDLIPNLRETFGNMRKHNMMSNPKKHVFRIRFGKFFGFMVSQRGIDANPSKEQAVLDLTEPKSKKDVMRLTVKMAALSRFKAKSAEKSTIFQSTKRKQRLLLGR